VTWGFIIFSESHSSQFWFALVLILCGLFCVRPNGKKYDVSTKESAVR
jgi:drug/metabolite transporter (DMT)-like permease